MNKSHHKGFQYAIKYYFEHCIGSNRYVVPGNFSFIQKIRNILRHLRVQFRPTYWMDNSCFRIYVHKGTECFQRNLMRVLTQNFFYMNSEHSSKQNIQI